MRNHILKIILFVAFTGVSLITFAQTEVRYHIVQEGQTVYAIARLYDISPSELLRLNPQAGDIIRPGDRLQLPANARQADRPAAQQPAAAVQGPGAQFVGQAANVAQQVQSGKCREMYQVQKKDNLYRLSLHFGLSIEEIVAANPGLTTESKLKKGEWLCIPYSKAEIQAEANRKAAEQVATLAATKKVGQHHLNVAVVLPLKETTDRGGKMVEFYQGLLMAVDSVRRQGTSIDVFAYHSGSGVDGINAVLEKEEMKHMDVVFGPLDGVQANLLNSFCQQHKVRLVMPFATTSAYGMRNPHAYIVSMQAAAINKAGAQLAGQRFKQHNIVFLNAGTPDTRSTDFLQQFETQLTNDGIAIQRLNAEDSEQTFAAVLSPHRSNLVVLNTTAQTSLQKATRILRAFRQANPEYKISLLGYPEWTTYQGNILKDFHELDTYAYATFFRNPGDQRARQFEQRFRANFNADLIKTSPRYGMLGMDLGYFFLHGLAKLGDYFDEKFHTLNYTPLQSIFTFTQADSGKAHMNTHTCFVHYLPEGRLEIVNQ